MRSPEKKERVWSVGSGERKRKKVCLFGGALGREKEKGEEGLLLESGTLGGKYSRSRGGKKRSGLISFTGLFRKEKRTMVVQKIRAARSVFGRERGNEGHHLILSLSEEEGEKKPEQRTARVGRCSWGGGGGTGGLLPQFLDFIC